MLTKKNISYTFISIIFFYASESYAMLTRLRTVNHTKKINLRNYSTNKDFKNIVTQQFALKNPISPQTINTLLNYNRDRYESLVDPAALSIIGMMLTPVSLGFNELPDPILAISSLSVFSFAIFRTSLNTRRNMIKILEHASSNRSLSHPNMLYVNQITQEDIRKNINNLSIELTQQDASHIMHQPTKTTYSWNINNHEILKDALEGKYNAADYTLYLSEKE